MSFLYLTADTIGTETGGGVVTKNELEALRTLGEVRVWARGHFIQRTVQGTFVAAEDTKEPWYFDAIAASDIALWEEEDYPKLCHAYAGTWGKTVKALKERGVKVVVTIAAHDVAKSRAAHEELGWPFPFPHLTEPELWQRYIEGYRLADVIVCPSTVAAKTVRAYGPDFEGKDIRVIPHGCHLPEKVAPLPKQFTVGYLGSYGADKGVIDLLRAWKQLNYKDAALVLAGKDSTSEMVYRMVQAVGCGNVHFAGWMKSVSDFYNQISLFVCPARTEGFNIEVVEALAHARPVVCSNGAGAQDCLVDSEGHELLRACEVYEAGNLDGLVESIDWHKQHPISDGSVAISEIRGRASQFTWSKIRQLYVGLWRELLCNTSV